MEELDQWIRHRVRQFILKKWKNYRTRVKNLVRLSPQYKKANWGNAVETDWMRKISKASGNRAYWKASQYAVVNQILTSQWMRGQGMIFLLDLWKKRRETVSTATYRTVCVVV